VKPGPLGSPLRCFGLEQCTTRGEQLPLPRAWLALRISHLSMGCGGICLLSLTWFVGALRSVGLTRHWLRAYGLCREELLREVRARWQSAIPGAWRWDTQQPAPGT